MKSGRPQDQALAISYALKRKNAKKMAAGGIVSAKAEKRPMPSQETNEATMVRQNDHMKAQTISAASEARPMPKKGLQTTPIKHPKMVKSDIVQARLRDEEDHLQSTAAPASPKEQPPKADDEMDATRKGPSVPALKMKKMAKGGMINEDVSMKDAEEDMVDHPAGLEADNDQMSPSEDEIMSSTMDGYAEGGDVDDTVIPDRGWGKIIIKGAAEGGMIDIDDEMDDHNASVAAAIMAKRDRMKMMAEGGEVDLNENSMEQPNSYYDRNEHAALKENYDSDMEHMSQPIDSNEHSPMHDEEDINDADLVAAIMRKMAKNSPITR